MSGHNMKQPFEKIPLIYFERMISAVRGAEFDVWNARFLDFSVNLPHLFYPTGGAIGLPHIGQLLAETVDELS